MDLDFFPEKMEDIPSLNIPPATYNATVGSARATLSSRKGTPQVMFVFNIRGGDYNERTIPRSYAVTKKALPWLADVIKELPVDGDEALAHIRSAFERMSGSEEEGVEIPILAGHDVQIVVGIRKDENGNERSDVKSVLKAAI